MARHSLFLFVSIFYMEIVLKIYSTGALFNKGLLLTFLLTLPIACLLAVLSALGKERLNLVLGSIFLALITLLFLIQTVYFTVFDTFFTLYSFTGTGKILQFWHEILNGIATAWLPCLLLLLPVAAWIYRGHRLIAARPPWQALIAALMAFAATQLIALIVIFCSTAGVMSVRYLYSETFVLKLSLDRFGLLTTTRLDAENLLFPKGGDSEAEEAVQEVVYDANVMEIDFTALAKAAKDETVKDMHNYFGAVTPTSQNEYTGMFAGKNLIWICAEGFSSWALDEQKTPTLYKLAHEGFVFKNFYNPIWNVSTSDGEYTTTTGLLPKSGVWSYYKSGANAMPFAMGNQLSALGYPCRAYHDHSYDYYRRDVSHPNMGYEYKGLGNGLKVKRQWPESDLEMMEVTIPEYSGETPFHTYYMTVSGHLEYNFGGNQMAAKHKDEVADLPYSKACRAYIACNMEFDQAMAYLLEQLEAAGVLDDTLIAISGDHYPYGLTVEQMEELNGGAIERNFELYHSSFILWNSTITKPIVVDKVCDAIDILPTLSNLMGLEYDSRLLMGRDILAPGEGLAIFGNHSWISDLGRYNAATDTFTPNTGVELGTTVAADYPLTVMEQVNAMFTYSARILEKDYYAKVFPDGKPQPKAAASDAAAAETEAATP